MTCPIYKHARVRPGGLALQSPSVRWTYGELDKAVAATQARLANRGMKRGDRVAITPRRRPSTLVLLWALWRLGAVTVPVSTRLPPVGRADQLHRVDCDLLITDGRSGPFDGTTYSTGDLVVREVMGKRQEKPSTATLPLDRDASIIFTSGSTGTPKAALHSWRNHVYSAKGSAANLPLRPGDRWLLSLPLYHVGGIAILIRCALAGAAVAVPGPDGTLADALAAHRATHVSCVATQLRRLLAQTEGLPSTLQALLLGGGPLPATLLDQGHARGWPLLTSYGCTEMASQVATTAPGAPRCDLATAGRRLPHRSLQIGDDGQILLRGQTLFRGYVERGTIRDPRTDGGWYPTGDRGRLDAQGRLHVLGRLDRMFVSGGENVQPEEIEAALKHLSGVERVVVVPVPNEEFGQRPVAFISGKQVPAAEELREKLARTLPQFKIPDAFLPLPDGEGTRGDVPSRSDLIERARRRHSPDDNPPPRA